MTEKAMLQNIQKDYKSLVQSYETRWGKFLNLSYQWILEHLDTPQDVIDVGCGTGLLLKHIHEKFPQANLSGLDGSPEMLSMARDKLPQASFYETDISSIDIKSEFDSVFSTNVLHHLNNPEKHLCDLHALCTEKGSVFLCDFAIESLPLKLAERYWRLFLPSHHKAFTGKELRLLLGKYFIIKAHAVLKPDKFWQLQIYKLQKV